MENWKKELLEVDSFESHLKTLKNIACAYITSEDADDRESRINACMLLEKLKELFLLEEEKRKEGLLVEE